MGAGAGLKKRGQQPRVTQDSREEGRQRPAMASPLHEPLHLGIFTSPQCRPHLGALAVSQVGFAIRPRRFEMLQGRASIPSEPLL